MANFEILDQIKWSSASVVHSIASFTCIKSVEGVGGYGLRLSIMDAVTDHPTYSTAITTIALYTILLGNRIVVKV